MDLQVKSHETGMDLSPVSRAVGIIHETCNNAIVTAETFDEVFTVLDTIIAVSAKLRDLKAQAEAAGLELLMRDGDCVIGQERYYAGKETKVRARDNAKAFEFVVDLSAGDMEKSASFLASGWFKYGAIKAEAENQGRMAEYAECFEAIESADIKTGKPVRKIKSFNPTTA